jgi:DNA topoisomerase-1
MRLRRSHVDEAGITRRRRGKGFSYAYANGRPVKDRKTLDRIRALAVPPAWTDVWICPWPNGHIQALGTDAAGRRAHRRDPRRQGAPRGRGVAPPSLG